MSSAECDCPHSSFCEIKTVANRDFFNVILKKETAIGLFLSLTRILGIPSSQQDISVTGGGPVNVILKRETAVILFTALSQSCGNPDARKSKVKSFKCVKGIALFLRKDAQLIGSTTLPGIKEDYVTFSVLGPRVIQLGQQFITQPSHRNFG